MRHLLICPEYPPAHGGGIGTYARNIAQLLAAHGETVHVIAQQWADAEASVETTRGGHLTVHRLPWIDWRSRLPRRPHAALSQEARRLFASEYYPLAFAWQAAKLAERLATDEAIDIIEAQEYEAPLYFLQLRRALGLSDAPTAPVIVHLHSPTELILRNNDYQIGHPGLIAARYEGYSIRTADAVLSPSRYLAAQVAARYGRPESEIEIIGYPVGEIAPIERRPAVWESRRICYLGRLEGRKGVLEWLDAAVAVASRDPLCSFDFVGENVLGDGTLPGWAIVERRIPTQLRDRFRFHGRRPRSEVTRYLSEASLCVVPSRWDNYPNTCIEAMSSGLPVLATREGGMAELVEDGRSGWLAAGSDDVELARALERALATGPERLAEMGREAIRRVRQQCDNEEVIRRQLDFRRRVVARGAQRSLLTTTAGRPPVEVGTGTGVAIVVGEGLDSAPDNDRTSCIPSLKAQSVPPRAVVLEGEWSEEDLAGWSEHTQLVPMARHGSTASAANAALAALESQGVEPIGVAFATASDHFEPRFIERCAAVLERRAEIGVVSFWAEQRSGECPYRIRPCPELPAQWLRNDAAPGSVFRWDALAGAGPFRPALRGSFALWDLVNAILLSGWSAVSLPEVLARQSDPERTEPSYPASLRMRSILLERLEDESSRAVLTSSDLDPRIRLADGSMSQRERFDLLIMILRRSGSLIRWFARVVAERVSR